MTDSYSYDYIMIVLNLWSHVGLHVAREIGSKRGFILGINIPNNVKYHYKSIQIRINNVIKLELPLEYVNTITGDFYFPDEPIRYYEESQIKIDMT